MTQQAPGKWFREGISLIELTERFPDEASAAKWLEEIRWPNGRHCAKCGCTDTRDVPNAKPMPYWCRDCKSYFSVRTGTTLQDFAPAAPEVGVRNLSIRHAPQGRVEHETTSRSESYPEDRVVHAASPARRLGRQRPGEVHRPRRGGRDVSSAARKRTSTPTRSCAQAVALLGRQSLLVPRIARRTA